MKRSFVLSLLLGFSFSSAICKSILAENKIGSTSTNHKTGSANYIIPRYVIGSGGIIGANGTNHWHNATTGQTFVGGMQSPHYLLFSGFWLPAGHEPNEVVNGEELADLPTTFELHQNYPNPFNPQTMIQYDLPYNCLVTVKVFNVVGQQIRLLSSQIQELGRARVVWDGRDDRGRMMGSGIYLYRVTAFGTEAGNNNANILFQQTKKMLLIK